MTENGSRSMNSTKRTRALKILSDPIDPRDFTDYKDVEADLALVEKAESRFRKQDAQDTAEGRRAKKLGKIFEAIIFEHVEQSNWFGEHATTTAASRYDDIVNKVDAIVEFEEGPSQASHLALAMDVTVRERFGEKFDYIKKTIDSGELTEIKYFVSEALQIRGRKKNVPHVVLGVDRKTLYDVIGRWVRGENRALADHPIQIKLLGEIQAQLEAYKSYAATMGKEKLIGIYENTLHIVRSIIEEKDITADKLKEAEMDNMFEAIRLNAEQLANRK